MNTLFTKILLWFGITLVVMFVGVVVITAIQFQDAPGPIRGGFLDFHFRQAVQALETEGKEGLDAYLKRLGDAIDSDVAVIDAEGRDLITGELQPLPTPLSRQSRVRIPFFGRPFPRMRVAELQGYRMLVRSRHEPSFAWWVVPQNLWILGAGILLCFALAAYLTSPLRKIQSTVEAYGAGRLDLRIGSRRRDEFGKLARAFDNMADRIQTLLAAERRLLQDISHELRSPLARLSVATELLDDADEREAAKQQIRRETERLNQLIGGLLEVTRAEGDPGLLARAEIGAVPLLTDIVQDCSFEARERGVEIAWEPCGEVHLSGDPELLRRAIENVARNALRFAPAHSNVSVNCAEEAGNLVLRIRDFGPGVPDEALDRIFDPFFRVEDDRNRRQGGTGLGLSIARRAVELHGGEIRARNANPGLCVELRLPMARTAVET